MARKELPDILGQLRQPVNVLDDVLSGRPLGTLPKEIDYPIDRIIVGKRLRPVKDVTELAASMKESGLLQRIVLLPDGTLVVGGHRVAAAKLLGWTTIPARIAELDEVDAELAEIDENLYRRELTVLEQAEHLQRRMELLEIKGQRAKAGDNQHSEATTTAAVAETMGISERSAQQRLQIARGLTQEARDALRNTDLAESTTKLLELAKQPQQYQAEIVLAWLERPNETIEQAVRWVVPYINNFVRSYDGSGYYAYVNGHGAGGMEATAIYPTQEEARAAFERGEYTAAQLRSHLKRHTLVWGSDHLFDQELREADAEDVLAAWQWRTTGGDKARTACNKMASKLRRLGYEAADIEAPALITPEQPTGPKVWPGVSVHTWEGYADWTDEDEAEYQSLRDVWQQPVGSFNSVFEMGKITRWRVAGRLAVECYNNLSGSLQDLARRLRLHEQYAQQKEQQTQRAQPTVANGSRIVPDREYQSVEQLTEEVRTCARQHYIEPHERKYAHTDMHACAGARVGGFWKFVTTQTANYTQQDLASAIHKVADEIQAGIYVWDPTATAPAGTGDDEEEQPLTLATVDDDDAALDILAPDRKELSSAAQQRNARIDHVTAALTTALNALSEFEQLTGAYTLTPALRRAIEPMLTTLEGNRV